MYEFSRSSNRVLKQAARAAIEAIERAHKQQPVQTLLRPSGPDPRELLRSVGQVPTPEPDALLRPITNPEHEER